MIYVKLKELMEENGYTQSKMSKLTGISQGIISDISRNRKDSINKKHLALIMKALNISDFNEILELSDK